MKTEVLNIFTCPSKGEPMVSHNYIEAIAGLGLKGDRYALGTGSYSKTKLGMRQVSFIAVEAFDKANQQLAVPFLLEETRRNIVLRGVDVNPLVGKTFKFGSVIFKGTELCDPCDWPDKKANKTGFKDAYELKGGLRAEVISGGMITIGEMTFEVIE